MTKQDLDEMRRHFESRLKNEVEQTEIKHLETCLQPIYLELKIINSITKAKTETKKSIIMPPILGDAYISLWLRR